MAPRREGVFLGCEHTTTLFAGLLLGDGFHLAAVRSRRSTARTAITSRATAAAHVIGSVSKRKRAFSPSSNVIPVAA